MPRRGTPIYAAGDPGQAVSAVRVGIVKLVMKIPGRESRIVRLLGRGATLGLEVLTGRPYPHTAGARATSLCRIPTPAVEEPHLHNLTRRELHGGRDKAP